MKPELFAFEELPPEKQKEAFDHSKEVILRAIGEGFPIEGLENEIQKAAKESERMQTPWFFLDILLEDSSAVAKINALASENATADGLWYIDDPEVQVIHL